MVAARKAKAREVDVSFAVDRHTGGAPTIPTSLGLVHEV
jgi:hypothetical protein